MLAKQKIVFLDRASLDVSVRKPSFAHDWIEYVATTSGDVVERLAGATIAITNKVRLDEETIMRLPELKMIAVAATGTDIIDLDVCRRRGILVSNIRQYAAVTVPEHAFALILALRRNLRAYSDDVTSGKWQKSSQFCLLDHPIRDLAGSRLGIIGYGSLGQAVARLGRAFGMSICVVKPSSQSVPDVQCISLDEMLETADVISLHLPLTERTRNMIGHAEFSKMKKTALLINTARGGLVDEQALAVALSTGQIGGAGFDVLATEPPGADNPLLSLNLPNFILTPHVAWASREAMQKLADQLIENVEAFVSASPRNVVF